MVFLRPEIPNRLRRHGSPIPVDILSVLQPIPWCRAILEDESFIPLMHKSRYPPPHMGSRYSFMRTLHTPETVPVWQAFYRPSSSEDDYGEARIIIKLGSGLDGHLHTAHGGVSAALLDEAMGTVGDIHKAPGKSQYTIFSHVEYKKPLPTPTVFMVRARLDPTRSIGRKMFIKATVEDGEGGIYNVAECLFVEVERKPNANL